MLWNWIAYHARQTPRATAVILAGQAVGYARFAADIDFATRDLRARLPAGASLVGIEIGHAYLHWLGILALARLGVASVSVLEAGDVAAARPDALLVDRPGSTDELMAIVVDASWVSGERDLTAALGERDAERDHPLRLIVSSGTTGRPKRTMQSATMVEQRGLHAGRCFGINAGSRTNVQMGEGTVGGFSVPVATWMAGGAAILTPEPLFNPAVPAELKPTFVMLSGANLDQLLARLTDDAPAFPGMRVLVGGSALPTAKLELARRRLSPLTSVVYGSTEAGLIALDMSQQGLPEPRMVGFVAPLVEVQIVDERDMPLPPLTQGRVRVRSTIMPNGYVDDPVGTAAHFLDGWFYPGDLGALNEQGLLAITGRSDETVNLAGYKVSLAAVEEHAVTAPGVADAAACLMSDDTGPLVAVGVKPTGDYLFEALAQSLRTRFGKIRFVISELEAIPRNRMGKIDRQALQELILAEAMRAH